MDSDQQRCDNVSKKNLSRREKMFYGGLVLSSGNKKISGASIGKSRNLLLAEKALSFCCGTNKLEITLKRGRTEPSKK